MSEETEQQSPRVLIVDDSRMVRATIAKQIRGSFDVREEADGEAGWQALLVDPTISVVVSDIGMPGLDGYGLLSRIRESKVSRIHHLPVIIISGEEDDGSREKARKLGANDFITKGIGSSELLARLESLTTLTQARRELEESREALASQSPVDPTTGLATKAYLEWHGAQELSLARRQRGEMAVMAIEIDRYDELVTDYGRHVAQLVARKLSKILSTKVRREDTVAQLAEAQFAVLSPSTDLEGCYAFALRLQRTIEKLVMTYRESRIQMIITVGVAGSHQDDADTLSQLIGLAVQRVTLGRGQGGARVMTRSGQVSVESLSRYARLPVSVDHLLMQIRAGAPAETLARSGDIIATLMPLFELLESRLGCGMPLDALRQHAETHPDRDPAPRPDESERSR